MLGGGVESGVLWALPAHPREWVPPFLLKLLFGPLDSAFCTVRALVGKPKPPHSPQPPPTPVHFFGLEILFCVIQSLIDSAWLLGLCLVVTHQHSAVKLQSGCVSETVGWLSGALCRPALLQHVFICLFVCGNSY